MLSEMVGELILDHDQVGLPGVGTFVAEVVPATFSDKGYTINPPYRRLSFYSSRLEEDLLIDFYASHNNLDRAAAKAYITAFLSEMKSVLKDRKSVTFPGLGKLRATKENCFFFVPDEDLDIYPEGFGLNPVSLKTHQESREEVSIAVSDLASILASAKSQEPEPSANDDPTPEEPAQEEPVADNPEAEAQDNEDPDAASQVSGEQAAEAPVAEDRVLEELPSEVQFAQDQTVPEPAAQSQALQENAPDYGDFLDDSLDYEDAGCPGPSRWWVWVLVLLGAVALFFIVFMLLARIAPDFIDSLLYTEEELRIINY